MRIRLRKIINNLILVYALIIFASFLNFVSYRRAYDKYFSIIVVYAIYIGLIIYWGINVFKRIMNRLIRRYLLVSAFMLILLVILRTLKLYVARDALTIRLLLYSYYIPMLAIEYCYFMIAETIHERVRRTAKARGMMVFVPMLFLLILALTNEYHMLIYTVSPVTGEAIPSYGYVTIIVWMGVVTLVSTLILPRKTPKGTFDKRFLAPTLVYTISGIYFLLLIYKQLTGKRIFIEFIAAFTLYIIGYFESLIQTGIIPSNMDYGWCFRHSSIKAQITDENGHAVYKSFRARDLSDKETNELLEKSKIRVDENTELTAKKIRGGFIIAEHDYKDMALLLKELSDTQASIRDATDSLKETIRMESESTRIAEQNRLYGLIFTETSKDFDRLDEIIEGIRASENTDDYFYRVLKLDICGVYVKRKSNLILQHEAGLADFSGELKLSFKETFDNLKDGGIEASFCLVPISGLTYEEALLIYKCLELALEKIIEYTKSLTAILSYDQDDKMMSLNINAILYKPFKDRDITAPEGTSCMVEAVGDSERGIEFKIGRKTL